MMKIAIITKITAIFTLSSFLCSCVNVSYQEKANVDSLKTSLEEGTYSQSARAKRILAESKSEIENLSRYSPIRYISWKSASSNKGLSEIFVNIKEKNVCTVHMLGRIDNDTPKNFLRVASYALTNNCKDVLVKIQSPGGTVISGIKIGIYINRLKWKTLAWNSYKGPIFFPYNVVYGNPGIQHCVSACVIAFMGGNQRYSFKTINDGLLRDASHVFFHQISRETNDTKTCITDPKDSINILLYEYYKEVAPEISVLLMGKTLNEPCTRAEYVVTLFEDLWTKVSSEYTGEVYERHRIRFCEKKECQ